MPRADRRGARPQLKERETMKVKPTAIRTSEAVRPFAYAPLYWLALGTFAVGTEAFMVAAILPGIAADLSVGLQAAGQLVMIFSLTYAVSSPVLTALPGGLARRKLLILSMAAFAGANVAAAAAPSYWSLVAARVLLALSAGLYVPNANALAGAIVMPEQRGRALAIISGGLSVAVALGVPLGAVVGTRLGWRMTFLGVAALATIALTGLLIGLPRGIGAGLPVLALRERLAVARRPEALFALLVTTLWAVGGFTVYTFIASFLAAALGLEGTQIGYVLFVWGVAAFVGLFLGGAANDRFGAQRVIAVALPLMIVALVSLSASARYLTPASALVPVLIAISVWGMTGWGFFPAQQNRLIGVTGLKGAPIILSLNASFQYLGFSLGAALGSFTLAWGSVADLGWVGGLCVLAALILSVSRRDQLPAQARAATIPSPCGTAAT
jgi:predicted MFS family arabinose efflux permease